VPFRFRKVALASLAACAVLVSGTALVRAATDDTTATTTPPNISVEAPTAQSVLAPVKPSRIKLPRRKVSIAYARIVLDEQQAYFYNNKRKLIAKLPVSTGLDGSTPTGRFQVFSRSAQTFYIPRPQEKMKFMTRFTVGRNGGNIGFHGIPYVSTRKGNVRFPTPLGIAPSSHGCIRMLDSHAKWVFDNLPHGATVSVVASRR
jgi:lipoprotein-anchoring transpeptidase ErfK/SrfK